VCVRSGAPRPRMGMPYRFPDDSTPMCRKCWRNEERRRQRAADEALLAAYWDQVGGVEMDERTGEAFVPEPEVCSACGEQEPSPGCWVCGYAWLRQAREQFEEDQAAAAEAQEAAFERLAAITEAEARVADVAGYVERLRATVAAYEAGFGGRAIELTADLLARLELETTGRASRRGRPPVTAYVGAVLANDSDWRSGQRGMPGRERTAWLVCRSDRAVYNGWKHLVALGWATRTRIGGRNNLARRLETGRANDRAEFNVIHLHTSDVPTEVRAAHVPAALMLFDELMQRGLEVLEQEQDALDELRARDGGWTDWPEQVRRAQLRAAVQRVRDTITEPLQAVALTANICRPHPVLRGEHVSSCYQFGLKFSRHIVIHLPQGRRPKGRRNNGASRSPTGEGSGDLETCDCKSPRLERPRKARKRARTARCHSAPEWASWAYQLARDLVVLWPWLAKVDLTWVAATLGARLGPDWTAERLAKWVTDQRHRAILMEPDKPVAYLRSLLDEAFTTAAQPPWPARRHAEHRREVAMAAAAEQKAALARHRAELDARDAARARATGAGRDYARAELDQAQRRRADRGALDGCDWPEPARVGGGASADSEAAPAVTELRPAPPRWSARPAPGTESERSEEIRQAALLRARRERQAKAAQR
jgi:hypothetical protein